MLATLGQLHGEGHANHPTLSDPLTGVFSVSAETGIPPDTLLAMDAELYTLYASYLVGLAKGRNVRSRRR